MLSPERHSALMSKITNDGLTWSGTGCFIAVPIWQQWASKGLDLYQMWWIKLFDLFHDISLTDVATMCLFWVMFCSCSVSTRSHYLLLSHGSLEHV